MSGRALLAGEEEGVHECYTQGFEVPRIPHRYDEAVDLGHSVYHGIDTKMRLLAMEHLSSFASTDRIECHDGKFRRQIIDVAV